MTPEELAGLLPTAEVLRSWTTVDGAREWAGLSEAVLGEFLSLLGNRSLSNLPLAGAVDPVIVRRTILAVRLPVPADGAVAEGTEGPAGPIPPPRILTALEKTQLGLFYNAVRAKFGLPPVDVVSEQGLTSPVANPTSERPEVGVPTLPLNPLHKIKLSTVLDQVSDAEVQMLAPEVILDKRSNYRIITGGDPLEQCNFTDAQLSALSQRVAGGGVPYADFAVWGPCGSRIEKRMKFRSSFLDTGGEWKSIEVPGPSSFGVWEECWSVFEAACIADGIATQATLAMYAAEFKSRVRDYGAGCWQLCVEADVIARSEQFVHERARQLAAHRAKPEGSSYDPDRPWESVIRAVALDRAFWDRQLEKPALRRELQGAPRVPAFQAEGERENPSKREAPPAKDPPRKKRKGDGKGKKEQRRKDGRYYRGRNGMELCFTWGRTESGCGEPCSHNRLHACEWRRQPHRSIRCPQHPNWKPESAPSK